MQVSANTQALRTRFILFNELELENNVGTTSESGTLVGHQHDVPTKSPDDPSDSLVAIDAARCHAGNLWACPEP